MKKIQAPVISRILSVKRDTICTTQEEITALLDKMSNDDFVVLELKQEVPNEAVDPTDVFSLNFRLQGHSNAIVIKENKTLMTWQNFSKQAFLKAGFQIGTVIEGYTLKEFFLPITKLNVTWGLDNRGNLTQEPIINPNKGLILLYEVKGEQEYMPLFRKVDIVKGEYVATPKPTSVDVYDDFEGDKKKDGKKTQEYQEFLNELLNEFVTDFTSIKTAEKVED